MLHDDCRYLYVRFRSGLVTSGECARQIMDLVFKNKTGFLLGSLDEDEVQDFLLFMLPRFEGVLKSYEPDKSSFFSYLYGNIQSNLSNWKRSQFHKNCGQETYGYNSDFVLEEMKEKYLSIEAPQRIMLEEDEPDFDKELPLMRTKNSRTNENYWKQHFDGFKNEAIIALALKCSAMLTEDLIQKIVKETGVSEKKFRVMQEKVMADLESRIARHATCCQIRDNAYYFRRKYMITLMHIHEGTATSESFKKKYIAQDNTWKNAEDRLEKKLYLLTPSNSSVADAMGISPRRLSRVLEAAELNIDILRRNHYDSGHETLLGYRQPEQKAGTARNFPAASYRYAPRRGSGF